jgi:acetyl esterase/lipase
MFGAATARTQPAPIAVEADGTVQMPAQSVPVSEFLSTEGQAYLAEHLQLIRRPEMLEQIDGVPRLLVEFIDRQRVLYPVDREETTIGGVHAYVYTPKAGIAPDNRERVLIDLHGGGFSGCWPACAELESMPVAALGRIRVVSLDYRQGPEHRFPAASEDVAAAYRALLETYRPGNIGIYGCSAGGMLTAMAVAWFQQHDLPRPGAVGILCAGAAPVRDLDFGGDAPFTTIPLGEGRPFVRRPAGDTGYFAGADPRDPLIAPATSPAVLAQFPPTLIVSGTRSFDLSNAVHTHAELIKAGVDADLHVWEGMFHGYFYNPDVPESRDTFDVIVRFFERRLGQR